MTRLALHINDAGLVLFDGQKTLYRQPGYAFLSETDIVTGEQALARARLDPRRIDCHYWSALSTETLADSRFNHLSSADLVSCQLEAIWAAHAKDASELVVALPADYSSEQLGLLLGIANELSIPVSGLVDAAVAATRREYLHAVPVHLDISLHQVMLSRMGQDAQAQVEKYERLEDAGIRHLQTLWLKELAEVFVEQSRFDPLHTAETEQALANLLPSALTQASRQSSVELTLNAAGSDHVVEIESLRLIGAAAPVYQRISSLLRSLLRAEDVPALQVTQQVAHLPGLMDALHARVGGEVFVLESAATAAGALARFQSGSNVAGQGVRFVRHLPWDRSAAELCLQSVDDAGKATPTHLLHGYTAYPLHQEALSIGSEQNGTRPSILLEGDMPGLSRHHCSVSIREGQCQLTDHSRYGTFLNGHRIDGTAVLQAGDLLRVGSPGVEFQLIQAEVSNG